MYIGTIYIKLSVSDIDPLIAVIYSQYCQWVTSSYATHIFYSLTKYKISLLLIALHFCIHF